MAKALPRGVREKNGSYEARVVVNGIRINLYGTDLNEMMEEFEKAKENARDTLDYRKTRITLNEWFEEWFSEVKQHRVKETSIAPMKNNFKRTFGFYIGSMKLKNIKCSESIKCNGTESCIAQCNARSIGAFKRMLRFCIRKPID